MPTPHRTFFYFFENYKNDIFREWWQKEDGKKQPKKQAEKIMLWLLIVLPVLSLVLFVILADFCSHNYWLVFVSFAPMIVEIILSNIMVAHVEKRNKEALDEEAEQYYKQRIKPLYDCLHEQDYDNQLSLSWIIQSCQEIIVQGCSLEKMLKRLGRYYVVCILPILSFCAVTILTRVSVAEQCVIELMGIGLLIAIFALSQLISPEIIEFASKRIRVAREIKESAEYLLAQGDLEIAEKPRAVLERESSSSMA